MGRLSLVFAVLVTINLCKNAGKRGKKEIETWISRKGEIHSVEKVTRMEIVIGKVDKKSRPRVARSEGIDWEGRQGVRKLVHLRKKWREHAMEREGGRGRYGCTAKGWKGRGFKRAAGGRD